MRVSPDQAYPFAARVLPGFHPWISDFGGGVPNYLPKYLDEQLSITENGQQVAFNVCRISPVSLADTGLFSFLDQVPPQRQRSSNVRRRMQEQRPTQ